jgi:tight adherence protein B
MMDQANIDMSATKLLSTLIVSAIGIFAALLGIGFNALVGLVTGALVFLLPVVWLKWKRNHRMKKLLDQLPDVFEMMSQSLRAGHSLAGAIQLVSDQLPDPAGTEFARVFHEQNLGLKIEDALLGFAKRCDQMDIRFFVTAVLIQRQTGGDLAEVLDKISGVIRGRIELLGQVRGLTAEGRMSGWVLLALPVVVFFASMAMNREYAMTLIVEPQGRMLLCIAGMMQLMGMAMIKKIVNIKI